MVVNIYIYRTTTSLTLAQPNIHYPIPTSFELTQRGPTDWVCVGPRIKKKHPGNKAHMRTWPGLLAHQAPRPLLR